MSAYSSLFGLNAQISDRAVELGVTQQELHRTRQPGLVVGFCRGSRNQVAKSMAGTIAQRASSLDDLEVFRPQMHVCAARAASWDKPADADVRFQGFLETLTGQVDR